MANYSNNHSSEMGPPPKKNCSVSLHVLTHLCQFMAQNFEIWGGQKNLTTFWYLKNPKKLALFNPANAQSVTYSKIQTKVCRVPWGPPMDWLLIKSVNAEYPLSCCKCVEKWTFCILCPTRPPKCVTPPPKMVPPYSLGICPPTTPKILWCPVTPSSRKNRFSEGIFFWQITRTALESPKKWHMSKLTKKGPRRCHKVSWVQIWQKNSNGKCPKLPKRNSQLPCY